MSSSYTKDDLAGLKVYDARGFCLGEVMDIAFTVGQETLSILVGKEGAPQTDRKTIPWKNIQGVGDIIILKKDLEAPTPQSTQTLSCPSCGSPLRFIVKYNRWYCEKEKKYQ